MTQVSHHILMPSNFLNFNLNTADALGALPVCVDDTNVDYNILDLWTPNKMLYRGSAPALISSLWELLSVSSAFQPPPPAHKKPPLSKK